MYEYYNPPIINLQNNEYEFMLCHSFFCLHTIRRPDIITFEVGVELTGVLSDLDEELYSLTEDIATSMLSIERALCLWSDVDILYWGIVYDAGGQARTRFKMPDFLSRFQDKTEKLNSKIVNRLNRRFDAAHA